MSRDKKARRLARKRRQAAKKGTTAAAKPLTVQVLDVEVSRDGEDVRRHVAVLGEGRRSILVSVDTFPSWDGVSAKEARNWMLVQRHWLVIVDSKPGKMTIAGWTWGGDFVALEASEPVVCGYLPLLQEAAATLAVAEMSGWIGLRRPGVLREILVH